MDEKQVGAEGKGNVVAGPAGPVATAGEVGGGDGNLATRVERASYGGPNSDWYLRRGSLVAYALGLLSLLLWLIPDKQPKPGVASCRNWDLGGVCNEYYQLRLVFMAHLVVVAWPVARRLISVARAPIHVRLLPSTPSPRSLTSGDDPDATATAGAGEPDATVADPAPTQLGPVAGVTRLRQLLSTGTTSREPSNWPPSTWSRDLDVLEQMFSNPRVAAPRPYRSFLGRVSTLSYVAWKKVDNNELLAEELNAETQTPVAQGTREADRLLARRELSALHRWSRRKIWLYLFEQLLSALFLPVLVGIVGLLLLFGGWWATNDVFWTSTSLRFGNSAWLFGGGISAAIFLGQVARDLVGWVTDRSRTDLDDVIGSLVRVSITVGLGAVAVFTARSELPRGFRTLVSSGVAELDDNNLYKGLLVVLTTYLAIAVFSRVILVWLSRLARKTSQNFDDAFVMLLRMYGAFLIIAIGGGVLIYVFRGEIDESAGIEHALIPYTIVVGTVTALIGFVTQESTANFVSGMMMQIDRPFDPDDRIRLETGEVCQVEEVGIRATKLLDVFENTEISVPNAKIAASHVVNIARPNDQLRLSVSVAVRPIDAERAEAVMRVLALAHHEIATANTGKIRQALKRMREFYDSKYQAVIEQVDVVDAARRGERHDKTELQATIDGIRLATFDAMTRDVDERTIENYSTALAEIESREKTAESWFKYLIAEEEREPAVTEEGEPEDYKSPALELIWNVRDSFDHLARMFYESTMSDPIDPKMVVGDRQPEHRYTTEGRLIAQHLATEPTVHSEFVQAEDGASLVKLSLRVYARLFERREEVAHSINQSLIRRFDELSIDILGVRDN